MPAPAITLSALKKLDPCAERFKALSADLPKRRKITAAHAVESGATLDDLVWVASVLARKDKDVERRLRLWMADCAARVLHIFEKDHPTNVRPREAIEAGRQYARGEIDAAARAAAGAAARAAAEA
ncbi:MAG: putative immunity protein, partial [Pikeienuella sp.]